MHSTAAAAAAGSHILSGNVLQPTALDELLPEWQADEACPVRQLATADRFYYLTRRAALRLPTPPQMRNKGKNYVVSLRCVCGGVRAGVFYVQGGERLRVWSLPGYGYRCCCRTVAAALPLDRGQPQHPPPHHHTSIACPVCSETVRWLGKKAEELGVELFPGFGGARLMYAPSGAVCGVEVRGNS